jgi:multiple sugar transport system substrate-binding protein
VEILEHKGGAAMGEGKSGRAVSRRQFLQSTTGVAGAVAGAALWESRALSPGILIPAAMAAEKRPFEGQTLVIGGPPGPTITGPVRNYAKTWEERTGGTLQVTGYPALDLFDKIRSAIVTGTGAFDVIFYSSGWAADIMGSGFLREVPKDIIATLDWDDIIPLYRERLLTWAGKVYSLPYDGDLHMYYYRKDLLLDPENQSKFQAKYGYAWDPEAGARTWEEYRDIAEFFTGWDWNKDGKPDYGAIETMGRKKGSYYFFFSRAAAYAKYPQDPAFFFDLAEMRPRINNPGFVKALENWINIIPFTPEGTIANGTAELRRDFIGGRCAQAFEWADLGTLSYDVQRSVVKDQVGFGMLPGAKQVYNATTKQWENFADISYAPFIAFGGWVIGVTRTSKHPDAAFNLAAWLGSKDMSMRLCTEPDSGVNPFRESHFTNVRAWTEAGMGEESAKKYLGAIRASSTYPNAIIDLRIPGTAEYFDNLEIYTSQALAKQITPKEALDQAAKAWDVISDRLERDKQKKYYRESLGIV